MCILYVYMRALSFWSIWYNISDTLKQQKATWTRRWIINISKKTDEEEKLYFNSITFFVLLLLFHSLSLSFMLSFVSRIANVCKAKHILQCACLPHITLCGVCPFSLSLFRLIVVLHNPFSSNNTTYYILLGSYLISYPCFVLSLSLFKFQICICWNIDRKCCHTNRILAALSSTSTEPMHRTQALARNEERKKRR